MLNLLSMHISTLRNKEHGKNLFVHHLTELFAPHIHQQRISSWPEMYPWIDESGLSYFKKRLTEARRDVEHGLGVTLDYFSTSREMQEKALDILAI